jgi:hypothetical protein
MQGKQVTCPNAATYRSPFQDKRLTKTTAAIKTAKAGETPSRPEGLNALAGCQNRMLKYARGTSVSSSSLETLDGVKAIIISSAPSAPLTDGGPPPTFELPNRPAGPPLGARGVRLTWV